MAEKFRFFDSTEDDFRVYRAAEYAAYFDALVKTGVFSDSLDALQVTADGTSLNTTVSAGKAFLLGYMYENDSPLQLAHDTPDPTLDRIDRVVIRLDLNQRTIKATIIKGTPSATPEVPQLVQDVAGQIYDVSLAQVTIKAGQSTIAQNQVIDDREYARYTSKPAWYPQGQIPMDAWIYTHFPNQLTAEEKVEIEANPSLMEIVNAQGTLKTHMADNVQQFAEIMGKLDVSLWERIDLITLPVDTSVFDTAIPSGIREIKINISNLLSTADATQMSFLINGVLFATFTANLNNTKVAGADVLISIKPEFVRLIGYCGFSGSLGHIAKDTASVSTIGATLSSGSFKSGTTFEVWGR